MSTKEVQQKTEPDGRPADAVRIIEARQAGLSARVAETWDSRRLVPYFARRFNEKRYMRTWLGPLWLFLRPGLMIASQVLVFSGIVGVSTGDYPYLVVFLVSFAGWYLFSETAYWTTRSLELNRSTLRQLYIPRGAIILGAAGPALVDFFIVIGILAVTVAIYLAVEGEFYLSLSAEAVMVVPAILMLAAWGLAVGLWLAVPGARARDVRFGLRYALNLWYFATPVAYPIEEAGDGLQTLLDLNPITAPIAFLKAGLVGGQDPSTLAVASSVGLLVPLALAGGAVFFRAESAALDHL